MIGLTPSGIVNFDASVILKDERKYVNINNNIWTYHAPPSLVPHYHAVFPTAVAHVAEERPVPPVKVGKGSKLLYLYNNPYPPVTNLHIFLMHAVNLLSMYGVYKMWRVYFVVNVQ